MRRGCRGLGHRQATSDQAWMAWADGSGVPAAGRRWGIDAETKRPARGVVAPRVADACKPPVRGDRPLDPGQMTPATPAPRRASGRAAIAGPG